MPKAVTGWFLVRKSSDDRRVRLLTPGIFHSRFCAFTKNESSPARLIRVAGQENEQISVVGLVAAQGLRCCQKYMSTCIRMQR